MTTQRLEFYSLPPREIEKLPSNKMYYCEDCDKFVDNYYLHNSDHTIKLLNEYISKSDALRILKEDSEK